MLTAQTAKNYIVTETGGEYFQHLEAKTKPFIKRFFLNVRFLMNKQGLSNVRLKAEIYRECDGFKIGLNAVTQYKNGHKWRASFNYLQVYCDYFKQDLGRMLTVDYWEEGQ